MKWNTKINLVQIMFATIGMIQLLEGAIIMALLSVLVVWMLGALENSGYDFTEADMDNSLVKE